MWGDEIVSLEVGEHVVQDFVRRSRSDEVDGEPSGGAVAAPPEMESAAAAPDAATKEGDHSPHAMASGEANVRPNVRPNARLQHKLAQLLMRLPLVSMRTLPADGDALAPLRGDHPPTAHDASTAAYENGSRSSAGRSKSHSGGLEAALGPQIGSEGTLEQSGTDLAGGVEQVSLDPHDRSHAANLSDWAEIPQLLRNAQREARANGQESLMSQLVECEQEHEQVLQRQCNPEGTLQLLLPCSRHQPCTLGVSRLQVRAAAGLIVYRSMGVELERLRRKGQRAHDEWLKIERQVRGLN